MNWPVIPYTPKNPGPSDQTLEEMLIDLERLDSDGFLRIITHGGERGYHIKLVMDKGKLVSLYAWNDKFLRGERTLLRSYGVWPIEAMEIDPEEGDRIIAEGNYRLKNGILEMKIEKAFEQPAKAGLIRYRLKLARIREYQSPKHGWSVRPEYYATPLPSSLKTRETRI